MKFGRIFIVLSILASTAFGVDKVFKSLPVRTSLVAKIDLSKIKEISFVKSFLADRNNTEVSELRSYVLGYYGLDIMKVKELWVVAGTENEYMFIARKGFDSLSVEKTLRSSNKSGQIKKPGVHFAGLFDDENNPGKKNLIAILDDSTVILAEQKFGEKYLEVFTGNKTGITPSNLKIIESLEKSKKLIHAKSINLYIPPNQATNPILGNMKAAELEIDQNSKYLTFKLDAEAKDRSKLNGLSLILNGFITNARKEKDPSVNPLVEEGLKYAKVRNTVSSLILETKFSKTALELMINDQLKGLEAIFE